MSSNRAVVYVGHEKAEVQSNSVTETRDPIWQDSVTWRDPHGQLAKYRTAA
jgi:hypothetical protein